MSQPLSKDASLPGKSTKVALFYVALILAALFWLTPVITLILTALKDAGDFAVNGAFSLPKSIRWANFREAWDTGVKNYFWNSVIVTSFKVPAGIVLESLAAFALTHMHFKWADRVFTYILIGLIVPMQMTLVPLTLLMNALNLIAGQPRRGLEVARLDGPQRSYPGPSRRRHDASG